MTDLEIRPASRQEFSTAVKWAQQEGWNPGLDDLSVFHATNPAGFIMGFVDGQPASSISVVQYGRDFGFLGFYIVHPDFRGKGIGFETWNAGIQHLGNRTIGLDGVVDQQENYKKSGFALVGNNIRHTGIPDLNAAQPTAVETRDIRTSDFPALTRFDRTYFPANREAFLSNWITPGANGLRISRLATKSSEISGYGVIRACHSGYKIGPLFAKDDLSAEALFSALCREVPAGVEISLDTPDDNASAVSLATRHGLQPSFETARMYKGTDPALPLAGIYGVTTFELG